MQELLKNAWLGWQNYTDDGKYAALLLMVLLFFWFRREECKEKWLMVYATVMTVCCIFPISAVILMKYQTQFYDYEWIWSYVPVTVMIAYGTVVFLSENCSGKKKRRSIGLTILVFALIICCGRFGHALFDGKDSVLTSDEKMSNALNVVAELEATAGGELGENAQGQGVCIWAPKEIMEAARGLGSNVRLIYGRNMWDAALGAYFYEGYGAEEQKLYLWMSNAEETGESKYIAEDGEILDGVRCMQIAVRAGANRIVLPGTIPMEEIQLLSDALGVSAQQLHEYYLFVL